MILLHSLLLLSLQAPVGVNAFAAELFEQDTEERLRDARDLLGRDREPEVHAGMRICVELDSPASVELLLETMRLTQDRALSAAHYRDVSWEGLVQIKDLYAKRVVEAELNKNKKSAWMRQWCAETLGLYGDYDFGTSLTKALRDKELLVRSAAARALGRIKYKPAQKELKKLIKNKDVFVRANAIEAMALLDPEANEEIYLKGLRDKDGGVRCALLATASEAYPEQVEALSVEALEDDDWRPRVQALENLSKVKTKTAVDALIGALEDGRPVVAARSVTALQILTGERHTKADVWKRWWTDNRESFSFPEGGGGRVRSKAGNTETAFNGIKLESDHVAFLMDKSTAMSEQLSSRGMSKDAAAHEELKGVFDKLEGRLVFNIFCYEMRVKPFDDRPAKLTKSVSRKALDFHKKTAISGRKDIWAALMAVIDNPDLDTAYLLSSGEPDVGEYVHWNRVTYHLKEINRFHKVIFHTIAYSDNKWYRDQLEKIAEATGGDFAWFE